MKEKTLFDIQNGSESKRKRLEKLRRILGRDEDLPYPGKHKVVECGRLGKLSPVDVLKQMEYRETKRGWVRKLESGQLHAYTYDSMIFLHKDIIVNHKHKAVLDEEVSNEKYKMERLVRQIKKDEYPALTPYEIKMALLKITPPTN